MKKIKSLNTTLTEDDFILIKKLLELNLPTKEIVLLSKRSFGTVTAFKRFNTFEEYTKGRSEKYKLKNQQETPKVENKPIVNSIKVEPTTTAELNRIANALERLANAWEKQPEKKGWLK